mmetsp:Transcript_39830/g.40446  ORF Transcript_39830/g.40446 Transcript_39830/m.40446 type:complete len:101 (-) Transcript_39830:637-939(-)
MGLLRAESVTFAAEIREVRCCLLALSSPLWLDEPSLHVKVCVESRGISVGGGCDDGCELVHERNGAVLSCLRDICVGVVFGGEGIEEQSRDAVLCGCNDW